MDITKIYDPDSYEDQHVALIGDFALSPGKRKSLRLKHVPAKSSVSASASIVSSEEAAASVDTIADSTTVIPNASQRFVAVMTRLCSEGVISETHSHDLGLPTDTVGKTPEQCAVQLNGSIGFYTRKAARLLMTK